MSVSLLAAALIACSEPAAERCAPEALVFAWADLDGDGFGGEPRWTCPGDGGAAARPGDCDDRDGAVNPGATEVCNGVDDDCDPATPEDEVAGVVVYADADRDGWGASATRRGCVGEGESSRHGDCDDRNALVNPDATEVCNGVDDDCDPTPEDEAAGVEWFPDADGDGLGDPFDPRGLLCASPGGVTNGDDCDDADPAVGAASDLWQDLDVDGYGAGDPVDVGCPAAQRAAVGGDCADHDADVHPGVAELCDGRDEDCDGAVDEDPQTAWWPDRDADGHGDAASPGATCDVATTWSDTPTDCDDTDGYAHPGQAETCDRRDNDCDGAVDEGVENEWWPDRDGDAFGDPSAGSPTAVQCTQPHPGLALRAGDCDDTDPEVNEAAWERCNGIDDDCDGVVDADSQDRAYTDADGDGYGASDTATVGCPDADQVVVGGDCDDGSADVFPGAPETCGGPESDCDARIDPCRDTCVWIVDTAGHTAWYDLATAQRLGSIPCELEAIRHDGLAVVWSVGLDPWGFEEVDAPPLLRVDPARGTCDPVGVVVNPELPPPRPVYYEDCHPDDWYEEEYGYGYGGDCVEFEAEARVQQPRFDQAGHLWIPFVHDGSALLHYDEDLLPTEPELPYPSDLPFSSVRFVGTDRVWLGGLRQSHGMDPALVEVAETAGAPVIDALDGRMVQLETDRGSAPRFADGRTGEALQAFAPGDVVDLVAVGPGSFLASLRDGSVVWTDGAGTVRPWLPASEDARTFVEIAACPER